MLKEVMPPGNSCMQKEKELFMQNPTTPTVKQSW